MRGATDDDRIETFNVIKYLQRKNNFKVPFLILVSWSTQDPPATPRFEHATDTKASYLDIYEH
jgi:hypothetical protein